MLIASKHEEISPPHLEDFCYITDNTYTKEEVVDMEKEILKSLNFEISSPTTKTFLRIFTRAAQEYYPLLDLKFEFLAAYLAELSLLDYGTVRFLPSMIAASVVFFSKFTMEPKKHPWSVPMQQCSGYKASELKYCVLAIHDLQMHRRGNSSQAIREKYKHQKKFLKYTCEIITEMPAQETLKTQFQKKLFKAVPENVQHDVAVAMGMS